MKLRTLWLGLALTLLSGQFLCAQSAKLAQAAQSGRRRSSAQMRRWWL